MPRLAPLPRQTRARQLIVETLSRSRTPLTAAELLAQLRRQLPLHKTTVYRNLDSMVAAGGVVRVTLGDGAVRYESTTRPHHHHLVCRGCRKVEDVELNEQTVEAVERSLAKRHGFGHVQHRLEFSGLCRRCRG